MKHLVEQLIVDKIKNGDIRNRADLLKYKNKLARDLKLTHIPRNSEILEATPLEDKLIVRNVLQLKPVRSVSGVSIITVMPKPLPCPKVEPCIYCPGGPSVNTPQSYTGREPASARALQHGYDPYAQVKSRVEQLKRIGHDVDKVELIIFGGTLTAYPQDYVRWFVIQCLNALSAMDTKSLEDAQRVAERASVRVSDITLETRPDYCKEEHVDFMLELGTTRVELGVQTIYNDIYEKINREHTVDDVAEATRIARDSGFAVIYHLMPNLPGSTKERDFQTFKTIFEDERFKPDAIKIYPTLVMPGTKLHQMWMRGEYRPYSFNELVELIAEVKKIVPPWVRIQRVQRDVPLNLVAHGPKRGDLRVVVQERLKKMGGRCRCIRCREVGRVSYAKGIEPSSDDVQLVSRHYSASEGEEVFLSFEDVRRDILIGLLRLRAPSSKVHRAEVTSRTTLVRELHVFGTLVPVGEKPIHSWQHRGYGKLLMEEAERISREEFDANKVSVLAGIGTREYYRKFGYRRDGPYMAKQIV